MLTAHEVERFRLSHILRDAASRYVEEHDALIEALINGAEHPGLELYRAFTELIDAMKHAKTSEVAVDLPEVYENKERRA